MKRIAEFLKVSENIFVKDLSEYDNSFDVEKIKEFYKNIILPVRATKGSCGYDFFAPYEFTLNPCESIKIFTGVRAFIQEGWFLACFPKSGLGNKFKLKLDNTVGIIDSDYFNSDNEGHIIIKITNESDKILNISCSEAFVQGVFIPFGITESDSASGIRNGGFGSTGKFKI